MNIGRPVVTSADRSWQLLICLLVSTPFLVTPVAVQAAGQVTESLTVRVAGTSATQALLLYKAPPGVGCTITVSEHSSLVPSVHDANAALFPGSSNDSSATPERIWVVGKRTVEKGADGNWYSRALQANTTHYYRMKCGNRAATGTFNTMNVPTGMSFADLVPIAAGEYLFPSLIEKRGYEVIDPLTGVLVRRITLTSDMSGYGKGFLWYDAGAQKDCTYSKSNGGYHCVIPGPGNVPTLYWINPSDGSARFLGVIFREASGEYGAGYGGAFDSEDPNVLYVTAETKSGKTVLIKGEYKGKDSELGADGLARGNIHWTNLTPGNHTLGELIHEFDPQFDSTTYGCIVADTQNHHIVFMCRRFEQDSPGWMTVVNLGDGTPLGRCRDCLRVVAAMPMYAQPRTRWCGIHFMNPQDPDLNLAHVIPQSLNGGGATGPWVVTLRAAVDSSTAALNVSGEPVSNPPPRSGLNFLQNAAVGDVFQFLDGTGEKIKLTAKQNANSWSVRRAAQGTRAAGHNAGAAMRASCEAPSGDLFWLYLQDPHGRDTTNASYIAELYGGLMYSGAHRVDRKAVSVMADAVVRQGPLPDRLDKPYDFTIDGSPPFAGLISGAWGNGYQKHPSYEQVRAPEAEKHWYLDEYPFIGGLYGQDRARKVQGHLYKYEVTPEHQFDPAKLPYFGVANRTLLKDVSGPQSRITGADADASKMCVAGVRGECMQHSKPGDIYFNVPTLAHDNCMGSSSGVPNDNDICIQHTAAFGHAIIQFGTTAGKEISLDHNHKPFVGLQRSRVLVRGLLGPYRGLSVFANAKALPDASWILFASEIVPGNTQILAAKLPPFPADDQVDRMNFARVPVVVAKPAGAVAARVLYGYDENGPRDKFYCTQRPEPCAVAAKLGSRVEIPAVPQRVIFYRVEYLDASGRVVKADAMGAAINP